MGGSAREGWLRGGSGGSFGNRLGEGLVVL